MNSGSLNHISFGGQSEEARKVCRSLGATGVMRIADVKKKYGKETYKELIENKMVKPFHSYNNGKDNSVIHLTEKGKSYTRKHLTYGSLYRWNRLQLNHDIELNKVYQKLSFEEQRSWQNESQIRLFSKGAIKGIDGAYTRKDGKTVAVEIVTPNYPASKLAAKIKTIKEHYDDVEVRVAQ
jgi:hypothetical protein